MKRYITSKAMLYSTYASRYAVTGGYREAQWRNMLDSTHQKLSLEGDTVSPNDSDLMKAAYHGISASQSPYSNHLNYLKQHTLRKWVEYVKARQDKYDYTTEGVLTQPSILRFFTADAATEGLVTAQDVGHTLTRISGALKFLLLFYERFVDSSADLSPSNLDLFNSHVDNSAILNQVLGQLQNACRDGKSEDWIKPESDDSRRVLSYVTSPLLGAQFIKVVVTTDGAPTDDIFQIVWVEGNASGSVDGVEPLDATTLSAQLTQLAEICDHVDRLIILATRLKKQAYGLENWVTIAKSHTDTIGQKPIIDDRLVPHYVGTLKAMALLHPFIVKAFDRCVGELEAFYTPYLKSSLDIKGSS